MMMINLLNGFFIFKVYIALFATFQAKPMCNIGKK